MTQVLSYAVLALVFGVAFMVLARVARARPGRRLNSVVTKHPVVGVVLVLVGAGVAHWALGV